ncbi:MAG: hypothetical protein HC830_05305 [Bacteroidetes bacterium]|nr:hypothetical protein [Bacteroidota bacterium]
MVINSGAEGKMVSIQGAGIPAEFMVFRTNSATENCKEIGKALTGAENYFEIPASSIVTLQAGGNAL